MRIEEMRKHLKLTQKDVADKIGVSQACVAMWETGEAMPRADKLPELAKILGCSIDDLYKKS